MTWQPRPRPRRRRRWRPSGGGRARARAARWRRRSAAPRTRTRRSARPARPAATAPAPTAPEAAPAPPAAGPQPQRRRHIILARCAACARIFVCATSKLRRAALSRARARRGAHDAACSPARSTEHAPSRCAAGSAPRAVPRAPARQARTLCELLPRRRAKRTRAARGFPPVARRALGVSLHTRAARSTENPFRLSFGDRSGRSWTSRSDQIGPGRIEARRLRPANVQAAEAAAADAAEPPQRAVRLPLRPPRAAAPSGVQAVGSRPF